MKYNFPETRFVREGTVGSQICHVLEEADEVRAALTLTTNHRLAEELADLTHSLETLWRKVANKHGENFVADLFARVVEKNTRRGYYSKQGEPA